MFFYLQPILSSFCTTMGGRVGDGQDNNILNAVRYTSRCQIIRPAMLNSGADPVVINLSAYY